jgi:hypothetical protein
MGCEKLMVLDKHAAELLKGGRRGIKLLSRSHHPSNIRRNENRLVLSPTNKE